MTSREIAVNTSTLANDIQELRTALSAAREQLKDMFGQITELDAMWDGPANAEFNKQFGVDHENATNLCNTVESLIECMEYARDQYNSCENEVDGMVSSIQI